MSSEVMGRVFEEIGVPSIHAPACLWGVLKSDWVSEQQQPARLQWASSIVVTGASLQAKVTLTSQA